MHHLPRFLSNKKLSKKMEQNSSPKPKDQSSSPRPKLVRRNAAKNFEYTPSTSTSPSAGGSSGPRTRSLDLSYAGNKTSFRVDGNAGEIDLICQSLGLSGPEDFQIPVAAFEAMKNRSSSDVTPRPRKGLYDSEPKEPPKQVEAQHWVSPSPHRYGNIFKKKEVAEADCGGNELKPRGASILPALVYNGEKPVINGGGIKGDRPPSLLTPPPAMSLPVFDNDCSTWELFEGLAPDGNGASRFAHHGMSQSSDDEEGVNGENIRTEGNHGERIGETVTLSGSCSFTTTNDDDSSSSTTEPVSIISPNGVCKVDITQWGKGRLLGKGSFGTVYEGISRYVLLILPISF